MSFGRVNFFCEKLLTFKTVATHAGRVLKKKNRRGGRAVMGVWPQMWPRLALIFEQRGFIWAANVATLSFLCRLWNRKVFLAGNRPGF